MGAADLPRDGYFKGDKSMNLMKMSLSGMVATVLMVGSSSTGWSQQKYGLPTHRPQIHINLFTPQGRPVPQGDDHFRYIVPASPRFGAFYTFDKGYYYTPRVQRGQPGARPVLVTFGAARYYFELAERLEEACNELCLDLHYNYRENRSFKRVYSEAYQLLNAAKFIHDKAHENDRKAIRRSATEMDNLFHHVQEEVSGMRRQERQRVGRLNMEGKLEEVQALLHHLLYDLGVKPEHDENDHDHSRPSLGRPEAPPPEAPRPMRRP